MGMPCLARRTLLPALVLALGWTALAHAATKTLVVKAGKHARRHCPMSVALPEGVTKATMADAASGKDVPCQADQGRLYWILEELAAGATRRYTVELGAEREDQPTMPPVRVTQGKGCMDITIDGEPFTSYWHSLEFLDLWGRRAGIKFRRPCFYDVLGPDQTPMTRPYPLEPKAMPEGVRRDHPHHTSIWVAHGNVNGVDNWSLSDRAGWQIHLDYEREVSGPVLGLFTETLDWTTVDRKPVMAETRTVRVWRQPPTARMLDLEVVFEAKYGAVKFGDTKEGGICATRMRPEFRHDGVGKKGLLINSAGQKGRDAWGKKAAWVDASGEVDGRRLGYAIFDHPRNLRHPTTWHARTYGLLTANPFGLSHFTGKKQRGDYTLEAGKTLTFRYRIYFHPGGPEEAQVDARFADYAHPPEATWE